MHCQGTRDNEPMFRHLQGCTKFHDVCSMLAINDIPNNYHAFSIDDYIRHAVLNYSKIVQRHNNPVQLAFMEAYYIKLNNPKINVGIAASKELVLFK